jgi:hypothetical protein
MYPDARERELAENISRSVILLLTWRRLLAAALTLQYGSEGGPVTLPVFKTGDWRLAVSMVRSTRTRFRQIWLAKTTQRRDTAPDNDSADRELREPARRWSD